MSKETRKSLMSLRQSMALLGAAGGAQAGIGASIAAQIEQDKQGGFMSGTERSRKARADIESIDTKPIETSEGLTRSKDDEPLKLKDSIKDAISGWFSVQNDPEIQAEIDKAAPKKEDTTSYKGPSQNKATNPDPVVAKEKPLVKAPAPQKPKGDMPEPLVLSAEDAELLETVVWAEAEGEGVEGRNAVRGVILNRIASDEFPDTLEGVLKQKNQFEPVGKAKGNIRNVTLAGKTIDPKLLDQRKFELDSYLREGVDASQGSTFFLNKEVSDKRGTDFYGANPITIGQHTFYSSYKKNAPVVVPYYSHNVVIEGLQ